MKAFNHASSQRALFDMASQLKSVVQKHYKGIASKKLRNTKTINHINKLISVNVIRILNSVYVQGNLPVFKHIK
jgi:hypothetical protein